MNVAPQITQKTKIGTCPHGLPQGACPICSGMGGGGGATKKTERPTGEMSWDECYAVWQQMLKAKELAQQKKLDAMQAQAQQSINFSARLSDFSAKMATLAQRITDFSQKTQNLPNILQKPVLLATKFLVGTLNILGTISTMAQKAISFVQQKLADISDKLNAMFGELKNSIEKKISDRLKDFKKKFKSIFGIYEPENVDDEEKKVEEQKRLFEMKNVLHSIKEKLFRKEPGKGPIKWN